MGKYPDQILVYAATEEEVDLLAFENFLQMRKFLFDKSDIHKLLYSYGILTKERNRVDSTVFSLKRLDR